MGNKKLTKFAPGRIILMSIFGTILAGTIALALPIARTEWIPIIDLFFTGFFFSSLFGAFRRAYYGVPQRPDFFIQRNLTCGPRPTCIDFPLELIMQPEHRVLNGFSAISALGAAKSQSA